MFIQLVWCGFTHDWNNILYTILYLITIIIVKVLGDRFLIVKGDSFGKSFDARKLNREDYKKFHKAISDFCIKNDIGIR